MLARTPAVFLLFIATFSILAAAIPNKRCDAPDGPTSTITVTAAAPTTTITVNQCNTGTIQCCNVVTPAKDPVGQVLLGLLGVVVSDLDVLLGAHCSPLSIGDILGGATCNATPVCCENNAVFSLVSIGCVVIEL